MPRRSSTARSTGPDETTASPLRPRAAATAAWWRKSECRSAAAIRSSPPLAAPSRICAVDSASRTRRCSRTDAPIEVATTDSLEALRAYQLGMELRARADNLEADSGAQDGDRPRSTVRRRLCAAGIVVLQYRQRRRGDAVFPQSVRAAGSGDRAGTLFHRRAVTSTSSSATWKRRPRLTAPGRRCIPTSGSASTLSRTTRI